MNLPMSWDEWADHDGVALAARVAKGELTAAELAAQAAAGIAKVDPALSAVVEVFEEAVTDPATDGTNLDGPFAGLPFLVKDLGTGQVGTQSVVELNPAFDEGFWHAFEYDTLPAFMQEEGLKPLGATTP